MGTNCQLVPMGKMGTNCQLVSMGNNWDKLPIGFNGEQLVPIANWFQWGTNGTNCQLVSIGTHCSTFHVLSSWNQLALGPNWYFPVANWYSMGIFNGNFQWGFNWIFVLGIARFQRKIRKFRLARLQSVTYAGTYSYCKKKKKAILSTTTENLVTPAPPAPDKGSIREIATGEITVSITPDHHLECPYLLKIRELPGALPPGPHPYEKNRMFQTHTHNWIARNHL